MARFSKGDSEREYSRLFSLLLWVWVKKGRKRQKGVNYCSTWSLLWWVNKNQDWCKSSADSHFMFAFSPSGEWTCSESGHWALQQTWSSSKVHQSDGKGVGQGLWSCCKTSVNTAAQQGKLPFVEDNAMRGSPEMQDIKKCKTSKLIP